MPTTVRKYQPQTDVAVINQCNRLYTISSVSLKEEQVPLVSASPTQLCVLYLSRFATESQVLFFKKLDERIGEVHSFRHLACLHALCRLHSVWELYVS